MLLTMNGGKTVLKKILYSSCALLLSATLYGMSIGYAQNPNLDIDNQKTSGKVTHIAQTVNDDNDDDTDWGWIGLIGLAGLLGLRKNDKK